MSVVNFAKWTSDFECQRIMKDDYYKYIRQFNEEEAEMITTLMNNVDFYDSFKCDQLFEEYSDFLRDMAIEYPNAIFLMPNKDDKPHNSYRMFSRLKMLNDRFENKFHCNYLSKKDGHYLFEGANPIIVIDDYSGSGSTIIKMLDKVNELLTKKVSVKIAPMFITSMAMENIKKRVPKYDKLSIDFKFANQIRYALCLSQNNVLNEKQLSVFERVSIENSFNYPHGYNETEELLAFSYYTPNNTVGLLWENSYFQIPFLNRNNNSFAKIKNESRYFSHESIAALRRCVKPSKNKNKIKKSVFAILYLKKYPREQIFTNLNFKTDAEYNLFESRMFTSGILKKNPNGTITRGRNFKKYVKNELFTRLVFLNDDKTRYSNIDDNLNRCQ